MTTYITATHFPADPCEPPQFVPADTVRERMMQVLLGKTLPYLWREELSTRTSAELRELIKQIECATQQKINYQPDDYSRVERDTL